MSDLARHRVLVVLCGINRHPDGDWATVAIATHPGGFVRSEILPNATAAADRFHVAAGDGAFLADHETVHIDLGSDAQADLVIDQAVRWPRAFGGGGMFSAVPFLGQYWHPHLLGGRAQATVSAAEQRWDIADGDVYAEKNWGAGFPERWWWGQASGFGRNDMCVAFTGGVLTAGPASATVGGVVIRVGAELIRLTPPFARIHSETDGTRWEVHAQGHGYRIHIVGTPTGPPHVLPVPLPAERRNADTDFEHLAGHLSVEISGRLNLRDETSLAGLEIGTRPTTQRDS